jgi:non-heme chloroperoxidase
MKMARQIAWVVTFLVAGVFQVAKAELRYSVVEGHGGVPLNVVEAGNRGAPGILLIHGFAQSYLAFTHQLDSDLAESFHIVAFDLRGHGVSAKPWNSEDYVGSRIWADDVQAVIDATGLNKPVLVGWSYGGYVLADYIRHYGVANIAGASLVGSPGGLVTAPPPQMTEEMRREFLANSERSRSLDGHENMAAAKATGIVLSTPNMTDDDLDICTNE